MNKSRCEQCAFMVVEPPTLADPGGGGALCTYGEWEDYAPPESGFDDCALFQERVVPEPPIVVNEPGDDDLPF